jgi:hypothetical protein
MARKCKEQLSDGDASADDGVWALEIKVNFSHRAAVTAAHKAME